MPQVADFWSSLLTWPAVVATVVAGVVIAVLTFVLNRVGSRMDQRAQSRVRRPSRRHKREARKYLAKLTTEPRKIDGPDRWSLTFNSSLGAYEIEHRGPDTVHDLRIDFIDIRTKRQSQLNPRVRLPQLPADLPVTMQLGAPSRVRDYGVVLQWDDSFGVSQLERIRLADAYID